MSSERELKEKVIKSNQYVHSFLVGINEYNNSPHFRPENQVKVKNIIRNLTHELPEKSKMIDFGCGTGFIINLAHQFFEEVIGIDITREMMDQVDLSPGNITLIESLAENTSFEDNYFDFATAYSFMDHLFDYKTFLKEVFRVLKPGGVFYSDLNPNRAFILAMEKANEAENKKNFSEQILREINGALHNGELYMQKFGMDADKLEQAEPVKTLNKGFLAIELEQVAREIGFSSVKIELEWFINQGEWVNHKPAGHWLQVEEYLLSMRPLTDHLYKYLRLILTK